MTGTPPDGPGPEGVMAHCRLSEDLDVFSIAQAWEKLQGLALSLDGDLTLDLGGVQDLDLSGMQALLILDRAFRARHSRLVLKGAKPEWTGRLERMGLERILTWEAS